VSEAAATDAGVAKTRISTVGCQGDWRLALLVWALPLAFAGQRSAKRSEKLTRSRALSMLFE